MDSLAFSNNILDFSITNFSAIFIRWNIRGGITPESMSLQGWLQSAQSHSDPITHLHSETAYVNHESPNVLSGRCTCSKMPLEEHAPQQA